MIKYCKKCDENKNPTRFPGFWDYNSNKSLLKEDATICFQCGCSLTDCVITYDELCIISEISSDSSFIKAMDDLKQKDIIEFNLKMSQFKSQASQTQAQQNNNKDILHCPKCNSTTITTGARGVNNFWGMLGASKTVNRCGNCGFTWKP